MTPAQQKALDLEREGLSQSEIAERLGICKKAVWNRLQGARKHLELDPGIQEAMSQTGLADVGLLRGGWLKSKEASLRFDMPKGEEEREAFRDMAREALDELCAPVSLDLPKRFTPQMGNLLVLDPADVHIGKLSVATETGYEYNRHIAEHRLIEGCRMHLEWGLREGVTRVLFIIGNDITHVDNAKKTSTSGTPQDVCGSVQQIYKVAQGAYPKVIQMGLEMGLQMDVMFNPSNHDWMLGYAIAQSVGLLFADHPNVGASDYYVSERHRKYYRFERNLIGGTHGDGSKESDLGDLMRVEARQHISECLHLYWYVHHYHHRIRKNVGIRPFAREKDHIGMNVIRSGVGGQEGDNVDVLYVRSPSPPDSWHDRNGYVNRQAVEAFIHHPFDGRVLSRSEWF